MLHDASSSKRDVVSNAHNRPKKLIRNALQITQDVFGVRRRVTDPGYEYQHPKLKSLNSGLLYAKSNRYERKHVHARYAWHYMTLTYSPRVQWRHACPS